MSDWRPYYECDTCSSDTPGCSCDDAARLKQLTAERDQLRAEVRDQLAVELASSQATSKTLACLLRELVDTLSAALVIIDKFSKGGLADEDAEECEALIARARAAVEGL